ncbi:MAG: 50S ribosomal protein L4 [Alphaproteobacteria bacterium RIFOXYD12_FULL_60_8]|nr:MAG: 50S ribosomal protein L4 [Alphaproteobacteria bacterium RIFOXYD12_FULL_60_8]
MKLDVINLDNKKVEDIDLSKDVFGVEVRTDILARMVNYQLAKHRAGTHKTKGRSEIDYTKKKVGKQKGGGCARHGARSAPQFRGGGKAFGPVVRSHAHDLQKKVRRLAMKTALSSKVAEGKLVVLDAAVFASGKTKDMVKHLEKLGWSSALIVGGTEVDAGFANAFSNIVGFDVLPSQGANVYDILRRDTLVLTKDAVAQLEARLK